jgi:hypothetical protein
LEVGFIGVASLSSIPIWGFDGGRGEEDADGRRRRQEKDNAEMRRGAELGRERGKSELRKSAHLRRRPLQRHKD